MPDWNKKTFFIAQKPYQIIQSIGAGSHASIWLARGVFYPHNEIIIKIAHETKGITAERVQNEIWFLKELKHDNIPPLLDEGITNGYIWLSQPLYQKLSISYIDTEDNVRKIAYPEKVEQEGYAAIAKKIPFSLREQTTLDIIQDISLALQYIAGTGIIHADISPGNIMEKRGSIIKKQCILIDWGASALMYRYPEKSFGSLHFTAPERLFGEVCIKSDLFSLGIVCFYILTGLVPYTGENGELYYSSTIQNDGVAPSWFVSEINHNLDKLIQDMIRCLPEDRPDSDEVARRAQRIKN